MLVCMYVWLKHPSMHVCCMFDTCEHVCMSGVSKHACMSPSMLVRTMIETLNYHPGVGPDSLRKMFSIWTTMQFFEICQGWYFRSPQTYIQTLHYYGSDPTTNIFDPAVERVCSMCDCMYVCLEHPTMHVCLKCIWTTMQVFTIYEGGSTSRAAKDTGKRYINTAMNLQLILLISHLKFYLFRQDMYVWGTYINTIFWCFDPR